jgi:hypothetical protein
MAGADARTLVELLKWPTLQARSAETVVRMLEKENKQSFKDDP